MLILVIALVIESMIICRSYFSHFLVSDITTIHDILVNVLCQDQTSTQLQLTTTSTRVSV